MKLLFVSNLFPDTAEPWRGLDNATLLHHLADRWQIRVFALRPVLPFLPRGERRPRAQDQKFAPVFLNVPYVPKFGSRWNHQWIAHALQPLRDLRQRGEFDVVLGSWLFPDCCALAMLSAQFDFPFVAVAQGSDVHQYLKMSVRRRIMMALLPKAAAIVTRSQELAQLLGEAGLPRERLHPIYNGVDLDCFHPGDRLAARRELGLPADAPIILFVGNFYDIKNPLVLPRALAQLPTTGFPSPPILVLVGGGPLEPNIRRLAGQLSIKDRVVFAGRTDAAGVARYLQASNVLCLPSKNEGVPNVVLEAFACGIPVVASRVGGIPEIHTGHELGRLVENPEPATLAAALHETLLSPPPPERLREHAQQFAWPRTANAYHQLLSAALT